MRGRKLVGILIGVVVGSILVTSVVVGGGSAQALTSTTHPVLSLNHLIRPRRSKDPRPGCSTTRAAPTSRATTRCGWPMTNPTRCSRSTARPGHCGAGSPSRPSSTHRSLGGVDTAGLSRNEDLEALAYDANADVLYAFSGSTPPASGTSDPTVYRLTRDGNEQFQVESWQALPSEWPGAAWRLADGLTYVAKDRTIRTYNYPTNTFGAPFEIPGLTKIFGLDFDDVTGDLLAVNNKERLYRASMSTQDLT